jgi:hypothetical protein
MQVKIIQAYSDDLEARLTQWIEAHPRAKIEHVAQSDRNGTITVTIFYTVLPFS